MPRACFNSADKLLSWNAETDDSPCSGRGDYDQSWEECPEECRDYLLVSLRERSLKNYELLHSRCTASFLCLSTWRCWMAGLRRCLRAAEMPYQG